MRNEWQMSLVRGISPQQSLASPLGSGFRHNHDSYRKAPKSTKINANESRSPSGKKQKEGTHRDKDDLSLLESMREKGGFQQVGLDPLDKQPPFKESPNIRFFLKQASLLTQIISITPN